MFRFNSEMAAIKALELAKANLENCIEFVPPERVAEFIKGVSNCLAQETDSSKQ